MGGGKQYVDQLVIAQSTAMAPLVAANPGGAAGGAGLYPTELIFQPGGTEGGSTYTSMQALYLACLAIPGRKNVRVDDSLAAAIMPAATYNWTNVSFFGAKSPGVYATLTVADGTVWSAPPLMFDQIVLSLETESTLCTISSGLNIITFGQYAQFVVENASAAAAFDVTGGSLFLVCREVTLLGGGAGYVARLSGGNVIVYALAQSSVAADSFKGNSGTITIYKEPSAVYEETQTGLTVVPDVVLVGTSDAVAYTPANGAQWANPDPTNVADAIDRLASAVYALRGNVAIP
jgi:hypothetical protein